MIQPFSTHLLHTARKCTVSIIEMTWVSDNVNYSPISKENACMLAKNTTIGCLFFPPHSKCYKKVSGTSDFLIFINIMQYHQGGT